MTITTTSALPCFEINPKESPRAAVIWLHGLGADGHDFAPIVPQLKSQLTIPTRFIFPHAPFLPVTINSGYIMRAWYDILALDFSREEDASGIRESARHLDNLIQREILNGIAVRHIVLAGFSQGGAVALHTGLRYPQRLAGILALSTYLPLAATVGTEAHPANRDIPIFMGHGSEDTVVPLPQALASKLRLLELAYPVDWHDYKMPHSICQEEVDDIAIWLGRTLAD